jgi:2-dehydro-3-deoxygluconokinase
MDGRIVCFGEMLIRLSPPLGDALQNVSSLDAFVGGAEANVAACLARLGATSAIVTTLPENPLGHAAHDAMRMHGVDTSSVRFVSRGRMGLYFLTPGAVIRPSEVLYDRAGSAFSLEPAPADADACLAGASRLHVSGITPAVSAAARDAALALAKRAVDSGAGVSFDGNYRARLWEAWGGDGPAAIRELLALADIAFIDHRDIALVLQTSFDSADERTATERACTAAFAAFPRLETIAYTTRRTHAVDAHDLAAHVHTRRAPAVAIPSLPLSGVIDRIGSGDAFAGGFLFRLHQGRTLADAAQFGLYAAALKHGQRGDTSFASAAEIEALMRDGALDVRR